jgi:hypothetical protein
MPCSIGSVQEELLAIERSLGRMQATKANNREEGSGKASRVTP